VNIEEALYYHLSHTAGVTALVSTRIYPLVAPQDAARPYLVYQRISTPRVRSHSGPSGLAHPRFQITGVAASYSAARGLANAVRAALDGYSGAMGSAPGVQTAAFVDNENDGYSDGIPAYIFRLDVILWHQET